ncbi:MAG: TraV family lipoprotein [Rhodospirillaceae bacterium]|nr:TraV family lipoprotein [Rhodospirillaceae bacterium]
MMHATKHPRRMALPAAALAALLLAGCSSGHVGESWQCPLADTGTCDSVAAADPAVPDADAAQNTVLAEPLWRVRATELDTPVASPCSADCGGGFDPFGWLARLFAPEPADREKTAASDPVRLLPPEAPPPDALPAAPESPELPVGGETSPDGHDDLRTDEVVARIWIAPFVDADGVYREASWVRAVLEPAGWRLEW